MGQRLQFKEGTHNNSMTSFIIKINKDEKWEFTDEQTAKLENLGGELGWLTVWDKKWNVQFCGLYNLGQGEEEEMISSRNKKERSNVSLQVAITPFLEKELKAYCEEKGGWSKAQAIKHMISLAREHL